MNDTTGARTITGREMLGILADLSHDFRGTIRANRNATPEQLDHRAELAEHIGHRVELRQADGTVLARGTLLAATVIGGAHIGHLEAGRKRVPLAGIATLVRLQARQDAGVWPVVQKGEGRD
ncbi:hypothetical protein ACIBI3_02205 [Actinomadura luteofluorescens]|uniref:hypothetical protein n=1 Tax=Actinomadura luteofluorescens TaxID=46163 RepID=UPI00349AD803